MPEWVMLVAAGFLMFASAVAVYRSDKAAVRAFDFGFERGRDTERAHVLRFLRARAGEIEKSVRANEDDNLAQELQAEAEGLGAAALMIELGHHRDA